MNGLCWPARPVERGALRIAGESDQRAAREIAVDPGQPPVAHDRPGLASRQRLGERIVAAGVEDDDVDPVLALHLLENERDADRAEIEVGRALEHDVGRNEIVLFVDRNAMSGIVDHRRFRARKIRRELGHLRPHPGDVEVITVDYLEPELAKCVRDRARVQDRVVEARRVLIGAVADNEGDALFGLDVGDRRRMK